MARNTLQGEAASAVPSPPAGYLRFFPDTTRNARPTPSVKASDGTIWPLGAPYFDVTWYGAKGDGQTVFDGVMASGLPLLTCATSAPFLVGDVGKRITVAGAGASGAQLTTTILAFVSGSQVTLAASAGTTVSAKGVTWGTDDTTAIQAAINAAQNPAYPAGVVFLPVTATSRFLVTATLVITKGITVMGQGGSHTSDIGDYTKSGGSWLVWNGTTSSTLLQAAPVTGASAPALEGLRVFGVSLDCRNGDQNNALIGLQLLSCHGFHVSDVFICDALAVGMDLNVVTTLGEARDCTRFLAERMSFRMLDNPAGAVVSGVTTSSAVTLTTAGQSLTVTANTLPTAGYVWIGTNLGYPVLVNYTGGGGTVTLTGCTVSAGEAVNAPATVSGANVVQAVPGNGCALRMDGDTTANTCCAQLLMLAISHGTTWGPAAMEFRNSDNIDTINVMINGGNITNDGAANRIRKPGVRLNGSNTSATLAARNNIFRGGSAGAGGVTVMGVLNTAVRQLAMSGPHYWDTYQLPNGEALPVVEGNACFVWTPNGGFSFGKQTGASVADQAIANALTLILGTLLAAPPQGWQVGTTFRWSFTGVQTAAAVGACILTVRIGTAGTTGDAAVMTATFPVSTVAAAIPFRMDVELTVRTIGAAATVSGKVTLYQGSAAGAGGAVAVAIPVAVFVAFNSTTAQQFIHCDFISGGAGTTLTFQQAYGEVLNPANP